MIYNYKFNGHFVLKKTCVSIATVAKHLDLPGTWMSPPEQYGDILPRCPDVCETQEHFMDCMNSTRASIGEISISE